MKRIGFRGYIAIVVGILIIAVGILYFFQCESCHTNNK
jgi:hypothetical protein